MSRGVLLLAAMRALAMALCFAGSLARAQPGVPPPPLTASFEGPFGRFGVGPADNVIAAGPESLVTMVNGRIALLRKDGTMIDARTWSGFDPKVIFDPHAERFIVLSLQGTSSPVSWLRLAVSKTATPENLDVGTLPCDAWTHFAIDADLDGGLELDHTWADFPGLGVDAYNVYVTANMIRNGGAFESPDYAKIWVIRKAELLAGAPPIVVEWGGLPGERLKNPVSGVVSIGIQPALDFDGTGVRLLTWPLERVGDLGRTTLWTVEDPGGTPTLTSRDLLLPGFQLHLHPPCRQAGSDRGIDTGLVSTAHVVQRGGSVWASRTSADTLTGATRNEIHWYQIDPTAPAIVQWGRIADPVHCYFYSAIQPDGLGGFGLVMSGVDAGIFPSAFYTARMAADPPGTTRDVALLQAGLGPHAPGQEGRIRWGDYGGIGTDPATGAFWMTHQFATEGGSFWGTWIGALALNGEPPTGPSAAGDQADRVECLCTAGLHSDACGEATIPGAVLRRFARACAFGRRARAAKPRRAVKLRSRAYAEKVALDRRLGRAERKGLLPPACSQALLGSSRRLGIAISNGQEQFFDVIYDQRAAVARAVASVVHAFPGGGPHAATEAEEGAPRAPKEKGCAPEDCTCRVRPAGEGARPHQRARGR